eukprot:13928026-Alexandrium_andersonii.AAC.1
MLSTGMSKLGMSSMAMLVEKTRYFVLVEPSAGDIFACTFFSLASALALALAAALATFSASRSVAAFLRSSLRAR